MKNVKTFFSMFGKLVKILNGKQKRDGIVLFFLLMIASFLEMLGVSVIVPFIMTMLEPDQIMNNQYVKPVVEFLGITRYGSFMYLMSMGIILVYVLKNVFILCVNYFQSNYRNQLEKSLNVKMLTSYMKRPYTFFLDTNSSEILRGINNDITNVASIIDNYSSIFAEGFTSIVIGIFLIYMSPFMAMSLLFLVAITALSIVMGFKKRISQSGENSREAFQEKFQYAYQAVNGAKEIIVTNRREYFIKQYESSSQKAAVNNTKYLCISKTPSRLIETVFIGGLLVVVSVAYSNANGNNVDFVTRLGALGIAAIRILPSISTLTNSMNSLVYLHPSLDAVYDNITEVENYESMCINENDMEGRERLVFNEKIEINNISWRYKEDLPWVIQNLSMTINKGDSIALIGESGAGKSTVADILLGLLRPQIGNVTVDGVDIWKHKNAWSCLIGYVPQSVFLIDDTIRNNVAFGIAVDDINDDNIWQALEQAQLKDFVEKSELGLDTVVGERGIKFSGGQRQRIAIARALYYNPEILVLDEATSALDGDTENAVMEAVNALQGNKTLIIIAHRLSTIQNCHKIYEIKDGKAIYRQHSEIFENN